MANVTLKDLAEKAKVKLSDEDQDVPTFAISTGMPPLPKVAQLTDAEIKLGKRQANLSMTIWLLQ